MACVGSCLREVFANRERPRRVIGIERDPELALRGAATLARLGFVNTEIRHGDGSLGWPAEAPYDVIVVSAAAARIPEALTAQLAEGGRMVIPVVQRPEQPQDLVLLRRSGGRLEQRVLFPVLFVPLVEG